ncbi:MAG: DUF933 domain-containing protein [Desulfatiglandaceae bacterium]
MKLGIIGLSQSGKSTVFAALTGARGEKGGAAGFQKGARLATITVADDRIDFLADLYAPEKTTYTKIEYLLPSQVSKGAAGSASEGEFWGQVRTCDALLQVVRNFQGPVGPPPTPEADFLKLEEEMILNDLMVVEKRIERIDQDQKRGKKPQAGEKALLQACRQLLEKGLPLRHSPQLASDPLLKGFTFLSAKPRLVIINNEDEAESMPSWDQRPEGVELIGVRARLEMDIAGMSSEEADEFLEAYHITQSALDRVISSSFKILDRICFFTVGSDEVKAWPIRSGTPALEAAGAVHSDIQQGFIRAEVVSFEDLKAQGSFKAAKRTGRVRLEGKEYTVQDGDIINFRFNI